MVGAFRRGEDKVDLPDRPQQLDSGTLVEGGIDGERVREICGECRTSEGAGVDPADDRGASRLGAQAAASRPAEEIECRD